MRNKQARFRKVATIISVLVVLFCIGATLYAFSPYFIPSSYLPATGHVQASDIGDNGGRDSNYYIAFTTKAGQQITYKYQAIIPDSSFGPNVKLYYNPADPRQVKIKPTAKVLLLELAIADLFIPMIGLIVILRYRQVLQAESS